MFLVLHFGLGSLVSELASVLVEILVRFGNQVELMVSSSFFVGESELKLVVVEVVVGRFLFLGLSLSMNFTLLPWSGSLSFAYSSGGSYLSIAVTNLHLFFQLIKVKC